MSSCLLAQTREGAMAAFPSTQQQQQQRGQLLYHGHGGKLFYIPALSVAALLTGFTFSLTLSSQYALLQPLLPSLHSLFLVSLPHLWHASLSWVTPPCLFLLLNGIIILLTATSGTFSKPPPSPSPSSSSSSFLPKLQKFSFADVVDTAASTHPPLNLSPPLAVDISPPGIDPSTPPLLQLEAPVLPFIDVPLSHPCLHVHDTILEELPEDILDDFDDTSTGDDDNKKQIISREPLQQAVIDDIAVDRLEIEGGGDLSREEEVLKGGSEPSTPKYSTSSPAMKDNMRRSLSIDSAPCIDNVEASPEYNLSEEAFKKRIEDYIFKVNAKLRSETRFI